MKLQKTLVIVNEDSMNLYDFVKRCQRMNQKLKDVNDRIKAFDRFNSNFRIFSTASISTFTITSKTIVITALTRSERVIDSSNPRTPHSNVEKKKLMRTSSCFYCKKQRHMSKKCSKKASREFVREMKTKATNSDSSSRNE